ncbi:response regulator [Niastella caeni]|uniref:histidine kinase n=2 Tax=Niastella caeni TaxID=2569763 RepID=A0A4S8HN25_9BACT|nr:response regulator [Niastella caeni]
MLPVSCADYTKGKQYVIAFSQCMDYDQWRQTMLAEMNRELSFHNDVRFIYKNANSNSDTQVAQINELLKQRIDLLIVSPNEVAPLTPVIEKVSDAGIPVVLIDRKTNSDKYTAFIGAENFEVGQNAGQFAVSVLKGKGKVMEITAPEDASPFIDRHNGFIHVISRYPGIQFLKKAKAGNAQHFDSTIKEAGEPDLIFAHNDAMANDAYQSCQRLGIDKKVKIIGVDGLPVKGMGLDMVANKSIIATVLYPTAGKEAILTALNILSNKPFKKENQLFTTVIDSGNVRLMKMQAEKLISQQYDIEERQKILDRQIIISQNQETVIFIIAITLSLTLILGGLSYYFLKENKKITNRLELQNKEISLQKNQLEEQKNQLIEMGAKAEEAHQAKLNFFTNISHEFRTPLSLILTPLEEVAGNPRLPAGIQQTLKLVEKNVLRLYKLVNQLMDFRKIEFNKMPVNAAEHDLVDFIQEIVHTYNKLAQSKNIHLRFITTERTLPAWFDAGMLDKVLFNMLSNAFKFTKENGFIQVSLQQEHSNAVIRIEDSGVGMSEEIIQHAFDPFFQGEYENYKGTGLGLALSKELIELHKGTVAVKSEKGKGTTFEIRFPLTAMQVAAQASAAPALNHIISEDAKIYTTELYPALPSTTVAPAFIRKEYSILIIEDNDDLRQFMANRLSVRYEVFEAANSNTALKTALDNSPDIIICDIVIPGKNGLELTKIFKSDVRMAHIPVILLTARNTDEQKIEGFKTGADAYITKPFNFQLLEQHVIALLNNRNKSKEHYSSDTMPGITQITRKKTDRKFISEFSAIVENNISNDAFSIEDICRELNISPAQLSRKVKALMECNVNEYIVNTRLKKAKYYLQHENLTIAEIAFKTGFSSAAYFSTVFKSKFSITPSEFKEGPGRE